MMSLISEGWKDYWSKGSFQMVRGNSGVRVVAAGKGMQMMDLVMYTITKKAEEWLNRNN